MFHENLAVAGLWISAALITPAAKLAIFKEVFFTLAWSGFFLLLFLVTLDLDTINDFMELKQQYSNPLFLYL